MSAKVTIIGNLGRDPETRINANNTFIANFSIAVNNKRKTATGEETRKPIGITLPPPANRRRPSPKTSAKASSFTLKEDRLSTIGLTAKAMPAERLKCLCRTFNLWVETAATKLKPRRKRQQARFPTTSAKQ